MDDKSPYPQNYKPLGELQPAVGRQFFMVILANIGMMCGGMSLGLPTVTWNELQDPNQPITFTKTQLTWYASINTLTCPLGSLISSYLLDKIGRKNTLYVFNVVALVSWLLMVFAKGQDVDLVYIQVMISRTLIGIASGLMGTPAGIYAAEISLPKMRSILCLGTSISVSTGLMTIYLLGYLIRDDWHKLSLICSGYQLAALLLMIPVRETPGWLISKNRLPEARKALNYFRGQTVSETIDNADVAAEFEQLKSAILLREGEKNPSLFKSLHLPEVYKPLTILIIFFIFQQMSGSFVLLVYAVQIAADFGVAIDPFLCAVLIGLARLLVTLPMGTILEKYGRRPAAIFSTTGMGCCMLLLGASDEVEFLRNVPYLPVAMMISYIIFGTIGVYTLPFTLISELFPQKVRGVCAGLTLTIGMFASFLMIKTYPAMNDAIGVNWCVVFYGAIAFLAIPVLYIWLPETKGRTLLEIEENFRRGTAPFLQAKK